MDLRGSIAVVEWVAEYFGPIPNRKLQHCYFAVVAEFAEFAR
jgi:hypothetical protein